MPKVMTNVSEGFMSKSHDRKSRMCLDTVICPTTLIAVNCFTLKIGYWH